MLARLWWKDARQFWPIWLTLLGTAAVCQWLLLKYGGDDARTGVLIPVAWGWALLYAFAVSSAAFAGERENQTLGFLDMLPVSRPVLWWGKASFALVTTVGLTAVLGALAWANTDRWGPMPSTGYERGLLLLAVVAVLLEVLGWGLFWSAVSSNAMVAAVLAMVCSAVGLSWSGDALVSAAPWRLGLALATGAVSVAVVVRGARPGVSWKEHRGGPPLPRERRERARRRGLLSPQVKALVWQTSRQVWPVWWRLNAIGFGLPVLLLVSQAGGGGGDWGLVVMADGLLVVVAGVSLFGVETRAGTQRFLTQHGSRPGVVWLVKLAVLIAYFVPVWLLLTAFTVVTQPPHQQGQWSRMVLVLMLVTMTGVGVGQLCGMVIRRGITAALVAVVGVLAVGLPQVGLSSMGMLPWQVPLLVPLALLAVSWAWSGDWMLERPGLARWGRLALWLGLAIGTVVGVHAGARVWGVPDVGPGFDVAAFTRAAAVDPKDNAADLYREAERRAAAGEGPRVVLDLVRRGSTLPRCEFVPLGRATRPELDQLRLYFGFHGLTLMVSNSARQRRESGDLAGAWDDLMVLFRMARHLSGPVPMDVASLGLLEIEPQALGEAMRWAADPRQTPDRLRAAFDAYRDLPPMPPLIETIRAESIVVENTLNRPGDDLSALVAERTAPVRSVTDFEKTAAALRAAAATAPWELARARRAFRLYFRSIGESTGEEPGARRYRDYFESGGRYVTAPGLAPERYQDYAIERLWGATPLARSLVNRGLPLLEWNDRNEVGRRALVLILALRHWQVTHDGRLPESLGDLVVSGALPVLPTDPYAPGKPFGYVVSDGQRTLPLGGLYEFRANGYGVGMIPSHGHRLLYSIGPDRRDDHAIGRRSNRPDHDDIIFPLPERNAAPVNP